jgi:transposase-like protein
METISMSRKERKRLEAFSRVQAGDMTLVAAGELLGLSYRQAKRSWSRYQSQGDAGLAHRLRGRASNRQSHDELKQRSLALYRSQYADYGPTLAVECMAAEDDVVVTVTTLRRWLSQAGLWERRRKRQPHRRRRPRRERCGDLVQMDGSHHDWFEGRRGWAVLMVMIDDATGTVTARFYENESWASAADLFQRYVQRLGLPRGLYVDQHSIYRPAREPTGEELLDDSPPETQFGRAMRQLEVELILARSPQAKGRVERMNGTLQDRLVKALRRAGSRSWTRQTGFWTRCFCRSSTSVLA